MKLVIDKLGNNAPRMYIVGDGYLRKQIQNQINELKINHKVVLTIEIDEKVYNKLHTFNIFIVSSIFEGFCNAMVEAMMSDVQLLLLT